MSASEKLRALLIENDENDDIPLPIPQIVAVVEAAEQIKLPNPVFFHEVYEGEANQFMPSIERLTAAFAALDEALS